MNRIQQIDLIEKYTENLSTYLKSQYSTQASNNLIRESKKISDAYECKAVPEEFKIRYKKCKSKFKSKYKQIDELYKMVHFNDPEFDIQIVLLKSNILNRLRYLNI